MELFEVLLFLHVLGAIVAFGPGFAGMIVGPMAAKEPQHAAFYARTQRATNRAIVTPVSLSMAVTGTWMIVERGWEAITAGTRWLEVSITLYVLTVVIAMAVAAPASRRLVALTSMPGGAAPSAELAAAAGRVRLAGMLMAILVVAITFLMIVKPF